ncbi:putative peptidyl-prolyl cis-trans isomerase Cbf2 [Gottschalkia purinilytica]|uniref:Putative peptidyl-prolyl cis-trans isomerase Cbf2 n=1 Tax=Gottschalkia purinilytica TaxID=1503 RepID=A0A0L0W8F4_GOTPU|nr:peptidyl-prolyl cis-trans isomerase [Gottschalkia purinilytica]KNF07731.1 putative peptidyl-prolyl cis-trans isomerase Cbf2 [Gottschalkia purinilytica]
MSENKVLAVVNGKEITEQDVQTLLTNLGEQVAMQIQSQPDGKNRLVHELINQELMYLNAIDNSLDKDEYFVSELEKTKKNLLIQYSVNKLIGDVSATDEDVVKYYDENKEKFKQPETIRASHILVKDEEEAKNIISKLNEGLSFEEVAKEKSECPSKDRGGDLGYFARGSMVPEFEEAAFKLEKDEISEPVKTQFGYHIIKLNDRKEAGISPLEEVKQQITQQVTNLKQQDKYLSKTNELKDKYKVEINL